MFRLVLDRDADPAALRRSSACRPWRPSGGRNWKSVLGFDATAPSPERRGSQILEGLVVPGENIGQPESVLASSGRPSRVQEKREVNVRRARRISLRRDLAAIVDVPGIRDHQARIRGDQAVEVDMWPCRSMKPWSTDVLVSAEPTTSPSSLIAPASNSDRRASPGRSSSRGCRGRRGCQRRSRFGIPDHGPAVIDRNWPPNPSLRACRGRSSSRGS